MKWLEDHIRRNCNGRSVSVQVSRFGDLLPALVFAVVAPAAIAAFRACTKRGVIAADGDDGEDDPEDNPVPQKIVPMDIKSYRKAA